MAVDGVINLYKPVRAGSARYVYRLRRILGQRHVGHAGTLDPFADGVLIGCAGKATRLVERLMELTKVYEVVLRLGVTNATFDTEQPFEAVSGATPPADGAIDAALRAMQGVIEQAPPAHSAVKVGGRPAYALARGGQEVIIRPREVRIDHIERMAYEWPLLSLRVTCGRGTYIRSLARDLGQRWACGAVCVSLRRTRVGPFVVENAVDLNAASDDEVRSSLLTIAEAESRLVTRRCA